MKINLKIVLIGLISLSSIAYSQTTNQIPVDTEVRIGKLSNGLTYYIRHNNIPEGMADFYIAQKVGSILEEEDQRGLAHFLEHMAFNGTKHFPGNTLVTELESKGIKFGKNINAFTAFDKTVYKLVNIPMKREGLLDTALLVLHDWSGFINNMDKDIDEERGVIHEEWRSRSSGMFRTQEQVIVPAIFEGSIYANRMPIGTMEVVDNFKTQELRDYYKKWYRPDLQGIVVVGDIDVDQVEEKLKDLFADIPAPVNPTPRKYFTIPDNEEPIVVIATDPELPLTSIEVSWKLEDDLPTDSKSNYHYFKKQIVNNLISNMLNIRFNDIITKETNPPFMYAQGIKSQFSMAEFKKAFNLSVIPNNNEILKALRTALTEVFRMHQYGFSKEEYEAELKSIYLTNNEKSYLDRNNKMNMQYTKAYLDMFLTNNIAVDPEWHYRVNKEIYEGLTIDTFNYYAKQFIQDRNMVFVLQGADNAGKFPSKEEMLAVWEEVKDSSLTPWVKEIEEDELALFKAPKPGKIVETIENTKPYGYTQWKLSNGVEVLFKNTNYEESKIVVAGYSLGGYSLVSNDDLPSALAYNDIANNKGVKGINGRSFVTTNLKENFEWVSGDATINHLDVLFKHILIKMSRLNFESEKDAFENWKRSKIELANKRSAIPKNILSDTLNAIMSNHHPRAIYLNDAAVIRKTEYDKIERIHKERFGDASDFTFIICGNIEADSIKPYVEKYLAGLPSLNTNEKEKIKDHGMHPREGKIKNHFAQAMETPQSTVVIGYVGDVASTEKNVVMMSYLESILKTIYYEKIREEEGGSYGVSVSGEIPLYPYKPYIFQVSFDTDPDPLKKEKLINIVYDEIDKIKTQAPSKEMVDKVQKILLENYWAGKSIENADYWLGQTSAYIIYGKDWRTNYDKIISSVTPEMIKEFANKIFSTENVVEVVMNAR